MLKTSAMATCKNSDPKRNKEKDGVISNLRDLFGNVLHIEIIRSVASQCNFDVQKSSNVLLEMTNNLDDQPKKTKTKKKSPQNTPPPKKPEQTPRPQQPNLVKSRKTLELERVVNNIRQGYKVLVILRGLPGSGKSQLARAITDVTLGPGNNSHHILSTDDFFLTQRGYVFDPSRLQEAHECNHRRAFQAMSRGLSPVIIDNTNTQMWEMKPYAMMATDYGYIIELLEPDTWWVFNDKELAKRNTHGVPRTKIKDMLDRYEKNVTSQKLLCAYNLMYKFQKPPQLRLIPPIVHNGFINLRFPPQPNGFVDGIVKSKSTSALEQKSTENEVVNLMDFSEVSNEEVNQNNDQNFSVVNPVDEILMCSEENAANVLQPNLVDTSNIKTGTKFDIENAWGVDEKALQSWDIVTPLSCDFSTRSMELSSGQEEAKPETKESGTGVDPGDYLREESETPLGVKVIVAQSRDINIGSPVRHLTPPKKQ